MIPVKGDEPGAFVVTRKTNGEKYVMSEGTLKHVIETMGEEDFNNTFTAEWVVLNMVICPKKNCSIVPGCSHKNPHKPVQLGRWSYQNCSTMRDIRHGCLCVEIKKED